MTHSSQYLALCSIKKKTMDNQINYKERYLKKLHDEILIIMDEIDRLCRDYSLRYYLMCGSCLGAVRHHGFIPWDDDLDIAMPRSDFNRLIDLILNEKALGDDFYLRWVTNEEYYNHAFAKICLKGTKFQESCGLSAQNAGIYVDIFPMDSCDSNLPKIERKNKIFRSLSQFITYKGREHSKREKGLKGFTKLIVTSLFSNATIHGIMLRVIGKIDERNCANHVIYGTPYPIKRMVFPKEWHGDGVRAPFEDRKYVCPAQAELYLERIYGDDYMQLPPENKRKSHYPLRVVFSDGEEILFEETKDKVTYSDVIS